MRSCAADAAGLAVHFYAAAVRERVGGALLQGMRLSRGMFGARATVAVRVHLAKMKVKPARRGARRSRRDQVGPAARAAAAAARADHPRRGLTRFDVKVASSCRGGRAT